VQNLVTKDKKRPGRAERGFSKILLIGEDIIKIPVFGCQKCGECILSHTGFICSQRCPKRLRNGPCGGTREKGFCEVFPERRCVWHRIHKRSRFLRRVSLLERIERIHNWQLEKTSAWLNVFTKRIDPPVFLIKKKKNNDA